MDTKYGTIAYIGGRGYGKSTISKSLRCKGCEYLHKNGNCLKVGGFFSSISDKDCPKLNR